MTQEQQEILDAVDKLNDKLYKKYESDIDSLPIVAVLLAGSMTFVNLIIPSVNTQMPEILLYSSENNDRIYYEKSDKYETFYNHFRRKFREIKEEIYSIKL